MKSLNKVTLIGNLGSDLMLKKLDNEVKIAHVNIATSEQFYDKNKQFQKHIEWHKLIFWEELAEKASSLLRKGNYIYVEGKLKTRSYENKDKLICYTTEIHIDNFILLDKKNESSAI